MSPKNYPLFVCLHYNFFHPKLILITFGRIIKNSYNKVCAYCFPSRLLELYNTNNSLQNKHPILTTDIHNE